MFNDFDFIGFTYNGKHSYNDFGVYRVIDGDRYTEDLVPQMNDKTAEVPGRDGQYFFGTDYKSRQFNINIAFEGLTEEQFREMRLWLDGKGIHDLIFDERPYKVYSAKVSGTPQLKYIAFSEDGKRVYKGEGTIQFTCYYPFAHTPNFFTTGTQHNSEVEKTIGFGLLVPTGHTVEIDFGKRQSITVYYKEKIDNSWITKDPITRTSSSVMAFSGPNSYVYIDKIKVENCKFKITVKGSGQSDTISYVCTGDGMKQESEIEQQLSGLEINHYLSDYPNKFEWMEASKLPFIHVDGDNYGDVPAPFIVTKDSVEKNDVFKVGDCEVTVGENCSEFKWDSKTGLLTGKVGTSEKARPIKYTGTSYGAIPVGGTNNIQLNGAKLEYNYWYY